MINLDKFVNNKILVIGDIIIDRYYTGTVARVSPEASVPVFNKKDEYVILGGAANTAANLKAAHQDVSIASVIGTDKESQIILETLKQKDINSELVIQDTSRQTTIKTRIINQNKQQMIRIDEENNRFLNEGLEKRFLDQLLPRIPEFCLIVLSDYLKGVMTYNVTTSIINTAKKHNIKVLIDVKDKNIGKYKDAFLIKPNLNELTDLTGISIKSNEDIVLASKYLRKKCNCDYVLTTQGSGGMTLVDKGDAVFHIDCISHKVCDVTGAGDTVIAYLGVGLTNNLSILDSMVLANYAAGIKVQKSSTAEVSINEVKECIRKTEKKVYIQK